LDVRQIKKNPKTIILYEDSVIDANI